MHILLLTISFPNTFNPQSHIFFKEQARALAESGVKIGVVSAIPVSILNVIRKKKIDFGFKMYSEGNVQVMIYQFPALPKLYYLTHILRGFFNRFLIKKYINSQGKPDIIHTHVSLAGEPAIWAKKKYHIPLMVTEHYSTFLNEKIPEWRMKLSQKIFSESAKNIAVSSHLAENLKTLFKIDFTVIPNLVDVDFFKPGLKNHAKKNEELQFINIGNMVPGKNQQMLIQAFSKALRHNKQFKLTIVGSGTLFSELKALVDELGMQDQIRLFGQADRTELLTLLQNSDYFVLSSKFETFGVSIIEAMACGLPVLSTRCGGPETIITSDKLGILCNNDLESFSASLQDLANCEYDRSFIRNFVVENYSGRRISKKLIALYESEVIR